MKQRLDGLAAPGDCLLYLTGLILLSKMLLPKHFNSCLSKTSRAGFLVITGFATLLSSAQAATLNTWFAPSQAMNSNSTWPAGTAYASNYGVAFLAGNGDSGNSIDWINLELNSSTAVAGAATLKIALRNTTNTTAYSAVAGATEYAMDIVSLIVPSTANTNFTLSLDSAKIPNISNYALTSGGGYSLIAYNPTASIGMQRHTGYANGATNSYYTTAYGFTPLDTFRNNTANYTNNTASYPTLGISFGSLSNPPAPVPAPLSLAGVAVLLPSLRRLRQQALRLRAGGARREHGQAGG